MRRLIAAVAARLRLRPRPPADEEESSTVRVEGPPTVRPPRQAGPARAAASTTGEATPRRPPSPDRARPPAPRQPARVLTAPPARGRRLVYAPELDGRADPGEIVWAWVPYEEDPTRGKDRPVLVVGRDGATLFGLMLSSNAARDGQPHWYPLGTGAWDRQQRPSWVRLDRVLLVDEDGIRREGDILARPRFEAVARVLRERYGWQ
jgi:hypothetical protein